MPSGLVTPARIIQLQEGNTTKYVVRDSCYLKRGQMVVEVCGHRFKSGCSNRCGKRPFLSCSLRK